MNKMVFLLVLVIGVAVSAQKMTVSVMDLNITEGLPNKEAIMLTDKLINELVMAGTFKVIERTKRDELLKEQGFQQSGVCDQGVCLVEAGQMLGVQKMFGGTIGKLGKVYAVELRMMDIKTGEIDIAFSQQFAGDISALLSAMKDAAQEFSKWKPGAIVTAIESKIEYGSVKVVSMPSDAKIILDGVEVGKTPAQLDKIEAGAWQIRLIKYGYQQYDTIVTIGKESPSSINALLSKTPITQTPDLKAEPQNVLLSPLGKGEIRNEKDGSILVEVAEGDFSMGSNNRSPEEKPVHKVYLDKYYIGKYEVTVGQFKKFCNVTGRTMIEQPNWNNREDHPVVNVSWCDAKAYCDWAGLRLPTEAEWEKAARGTEGREYPWGNEWNSTMCNSSENGDNYPYTSPVGSFPLGISPYGCHDMAGNVWEWCNDWYNNKYYSSSPCSGPTGPQTGIGSVMRGGAWKLQNYYCRTAYRSFGAHEGRNYLNVGFRPAK
ncbi:MAG: SUMF1/EgtB/PvdO family nonheme iron enzyme [bacterium]|nr:SUMF1/EgtB/PvdO family nonheme iron enzyme [bacterium]